MTDYQKALQELMEINRLKKLQMRIEQARTGHCFWIHDGNCKVTVGIAPMKEAE